MEEVDHRLSEIFRTLGNGIRLRIVDLLVEESLNVSALAEALEKPDQTVSRHLRILRDADLVQAESEGRKRTYWLKRPDLIERCLSIRELLRRNG